MKHLKTYETINDGPQIGDYVIIKSNSPVDAVVDFIENNIGQIIDITYPKNLYHDKISRYSIKYTNIPKNITSYFYNNVIKGKFCNFRKSNYSDIIEYSKNKEDLKIKLTANKYNL